jgi:hypothetical protein
MSDADETSTALQIPKGTNTLMLKSNNSHTLSDPSIIDKAADDSVTDDNNQQVTEFNSSDHENNEDSGTNMDLETPAYDEVFV